MQNVLISTSDMVVTGKKKLSPFFCKQYQSPYVLSLGFYSFSSLARDSTVNTLLSVCFLSLYSFSKDFLFITVFTIEEKKHFVFLTPCWKTMFSPFLFTVSTSDAF